MQLASLVWRWRLFMRLELPPLPMGKLPLFRSPPRSPRFTTHMARGRSGSGAERTPRRLRSSPLYSSERRSMAFRKGPNSQPRSRPPRPGCERQAGRRCECGARAVFSLGPICAGGQKADGRHDLRLSRPSAAGRSRRHDPSHGGFSPFPRGLSCKHFGRERRLQAAARHRLG